MGWHSKCPADGFPNNAGSRATWRIFSICVLLIFFSSHASASIAWSIMPDRDFSLSGLVPDWSGVILDSGVIPLAGVTGSDVYAGVEVFAPLENEIPLPATPPVTEAMVKKAAAEFLDLLGYGNSDPPILARLANLSMKPGAWFLASTPLVWSMMLWHVRPASRRRIRVRRRRCGNTAGAAAARS